jgi:hypothetical protein
VILADRARLDETLDASPSSGSMFSARAHIVAWSVEILVGNAGSAVCRSGGLAVAGGLSRPAHRPIALRQLSALRQLIALLGR